MSTTDLVERMAAVRLRTLERLESWTAEQRLTDPAAVGFVVAARFRFVLILSAAARGVGLRYLDRGDPDDAALLREILEAIHDLVAPLTDGLEAPRPDEQVH